MLVRPKHGILDPQGEAVESALGHLGFSVSEARVGKVVDLEVDASDAAEARYLANLFVGLEGKGIVDRVLLPPAQVERMCEQLLSNPLIESFEVEIHG